MAEFFADEFEAPERLFYRANQMPQITEGLVTIRQLGRSMSNRKLQVLHETYQANGDTGLSMLSHEGEEAGVVVSGNIEITVGSQTEVLGPGDGYYFSSRLPHRFRNSGPEACEIVSVCTPPTF